VDIETHFGVDYELPYKGKSKKLNLSGMNPHEHSILLFQIGTKDVQYIIDCRTQSLEPVIRALENSNNTIVGHNLKFDLSWLNVKYNYVPNKLFDTMVVEKCLTQGKFDSYWDEQKKKMVPGLSKKPYSLNSVAKRNLNFDYDNKQLHLFEPRAPKSIRDSFPGIKDEPLTIEQLTYSRYDVIIPYLLYEFYNKEKLPKIVDIENEYVKVLIDMETTGIALNTEAWMNNAFVKQSEVFEILEKLNTYGTINWKSSKQKLALLDSLGINPTDKYGKPTTGKAVLAKIDTDITKLLNSLSVVNKAVDSFGIKFLSYINNKTKKLHTNYNQMVNNGRLSSNSPNLQQIPRDNAYRHCFYDPEGITVCDYASMEVRRVAECANEKYLIDALNAGLDPHLETAKKLFNLTGLSESEIAKKRTIAKTLNFSIIYGVSAWKLANDYGVPQREAQQWIDDYFKMYPNIALFLKKVRALAIKNGYIVIDKYGRRAYFSEWGRLQALRDEISRQEAIGFAPERSLVIEANKLQGDIERAAGNYIISGSCATINKLAGILMRKKGLLCLLAVHDENAVRGNFVAEVENCMVEAWNLLNSKVTMPLKGEYSKTWFK